MYSDLDNNLLSFNIINKATAEAVNFHLRVSNNGKLKEI